MAADAATLVSASDNNGGQRGDGGGVAADGQGIDKADLVGAGGFGQSPQEGRFRLRHGHGFQRVTGRMGELIVGQQGGERRDATGVANPFEAGAGLVLFLQANDRIAGWR